MTRVLASALVVFALTAGVSAAPTGVVVDFSTVGPVDQHAGRSIGGAIAIAPGGVQVTPHNFNLNDTDVRQFDETVTATAGTGDVHAFAAASLKLSLTTSGDTLALSTTAAVGGARTVTNDLREDEGTIIGGGERYALSFKVSTRSTFVLAGSLQSDPNHFDESTITFRRSDVATQFEAVAGNVDPFNGREAPGRMTVSVSQSGTIEAGTTIELRLFVQSSIELAVHDPGSSSMRGGWNVTLDVTPAAPAGSDVRWTNKKGGGFGNAANWDTRQVPVKDSTNTDNALFDIQGRYAVDFAVPKSEVASPRSSVLRTSDRLEILRGDVAFTNANFTVDNLSLAQPSLVVDTGRLILASGQVTSNSATIGDLHSVGAEVQVNGANSRWDCLGRLRVGGSGGSGGDGRLTVSGGAAMTSAETRIGAGGAQPGFATADGEGTNWSTGDIAVGFSSGGQLGIGDGARVTSDQAFVGLGQGPADVAIVAVNGVGPTGVVSAWTTNRLVVGRTSGINAVHVTDGATVSAADGVAVGDVAGGSGFVTVSGLHAATQKASVLLSTHNLIVGKDGGNGEFDIDDDAEVSVVDDVEIGSGGFGDVVVETLGAPSARFASLTVGGTLTIGSRTGGEGSLAIRGGNLVTCAQVFVGLLSGGHGAATVSGASVLETSGDMFVGALGGTGDIVLDDGIVNVGGDLTVGDAVVPGGAGAISGSGVVGVKGAFVLNGTLASSVAILRAPSTPKRFVAPRATPAAPQFGTLTIDGDLVVGPAGVITAEAAGAQPDKVIVTGSATLDGTLVLQFKNGFAPKTGASFEVFHVDGAVAGAFASVETRGLAPGAQFDVATSGGAITATATNDAVALPTVSVKASTKKLLEKKTKKTAALTFSRKGVATAPLTVAYTVRGTATNGLDFVLLSGSVTIPAKKKSAKVTVRIVDDSAHEGAETIDVAVVPGADYTHSLVSSARITVVDND